MAEMGDEGAHGAGLHHAHFCGVLMSDLNTPLVDVKEELFMMSNLGK